jgi:hypothetical protein
VTGLENLPCAQLYWEVDLAGPAERPRELDMQESHRGAPSGADQSDLECRFD